MSKKAIQFSQKKSVLRFFLLLCLALVVAMAVMIFSSKSFAEDDLSYLERAREKKYLGGADESDLKVIAVAPSLKNKKIKTEEAEEGF